MTTTDACLGSRPVANAFGAESSITKSVGGWMPRPIARVSTMLRSCGSSPCFSSRAWLCASTILSPAKHEVAAEAPEKANAMGSAAIPPPGAKYSPTKYASSETIAVKTTMSASVRQRFAAAAS